MKDQLDRIEQRLQSLIETGLPGLIPLGIANRTLVHDLVRAMQANLYTASDGTVYAPNAFTLKVSPERLPDWQADPSILTNVAHKLMQAAGEAGVRFFHEPVLRVLADPAISFDDVKTTASIDSEELSETAAIPIQPPDANGQDAFPRNAFLIIKGVQVYPLRQPVINIGRRVDNQLILDDPRVSRTHAQMRAIRGQYILFDLNSTGGTYVNGQRISRYILNPGDVISLAGVALIYGQDAIASDSDETQTPGEHLPPGTTQSLPRLSKDDSLGPTPHL